VHLPLYSSLRLGRHQDRLVKFLATIANLLWYWLNREYSQQFG
jgi:hypothetical protein